MKNSQGNSLVLFAPEGSHQFPGKFCWPGPGPGFGCFHGDTTKPYRKSIQHTTNGIGFCTRTPTRFLELRLDVPQFVRSSPLLRGYHSASFSLRSCLSLSTCCIVIISSYLSPFLDGRNKNLPFSVSIESTKSPSQTKTNKKSPLWWSKSHPLPVFLNNVLLVHSQAHLCTYCLW